MKFKKGAEITNEYFKKSNIEGAEQMKKSLEYIKKEDPVLADKLAKFTEKSIEIDRITEDIVKYLLDSEKVIHTAEKIKSVLHPLEHKLAESIKKFEVSDNNSIILKFE